MGGSVPAASRRFARPAPSAPAATVEPGGAAPVTNKSGIELTQRDRDQISGINREWQEKISASRDGLKEPRTTDDSAPDAAGQQAATPPPPPASKFSQANLDRAARYGLAAVELDDFDNDKQLERHFSHLERLARGVYESARRQFSQPPPATQATTAPGAPPADDPNKPPTLDDDYDPSLKKYADWTVQQIQQMQEELVQYRGLADAAREQEFKRETAWLDEQFSKLGDLFIPVIGKGDAEALRGSKPGEFHNRAEIARRYMQELEWNPSLKRETAFSRAVHALHFDVFEKQQQADLAKKVRGAQAERINNGTRTSHVSETDKKINPFKDKNPANHPKLVEAWEEMHAGHA